MENLEGGTLALEHRYEVLQSEGRLGLATRYRGEQFPFQKSVTIGIWDVLEGAPEGLAAAIKSRAEAAAVLAVEGVDSVVDYGEIDRGVPFVVVSRPQGTSLARILERDSTLSTDDAIVLICRLCDVLAGVHRRNVAHGAVWTHLVTLPGEDPKLARISDVGLNLRVSEAREIDEGVLDFSFVAPLPPEAFGGSPPPPDQLYDVYALGALAYTCIAGTHPFFDDAEDISEGLLRIQKAKSAPLTTFGVDDDVSSIVARALDPDPKRRISSVDQLAKELRGLSGDATAASVAEPDEPDWEPMSEVDVADVVPDAPTAEPRKLEPTPRNTTFGLLLFILIASNLAWVFYRGQEMSTGASTAAAPAAQTSGSVLRAGVEIASDPVGAKVLKVDSAGETELGSTPLVIDPTIGTEGRVQVRVQQPGFVPMDLEVLASDQGRTVTLRLVPESN